MVEDMNTAQVERQIPQFANASMKTLSGLVLGVSKSFGYDLTSKADRVDQFFASGGCGLVPLIALADDLNEMKKRVSKISDGAPISAQLGLVSVGTEVVFDGYEIADSLSQLFPGCFFDGVSNNSSIYAMNIKVAGSVILALSAIDEAYAEIFQTTGYLGSKPSFPSHGEDFSLSDTFIGKQFAGDLEDTQDELYKQQVSSALRAAEVGFAALSNLALLAGGGPNTAFVATSIISNGFKYARMSYNCQNGV